MDTTHSPAGGGGQTPTPKYFILERGHAWNEHTLHVFDTAGQRAEKTAELIFGDESGKLTDDETEQWKAHCKELEDSGSIEFEGDPGLEWFTAHDSRERADQQALHAMRSEIDRLNELTTQRPVFDADLTPAGHSALAAVSTWLSAPNSSAYTADEIKALVARALFAPSKLP